MSEVQLPNQFQKQPNTNVVPGKRSSTLALLFAVLLLGLAAFVFLNRQAIIDQFTVWQFKPSAEIASIADRAQLSDKGKYYLYASQAEVDDRAKFNAECGTLQNEKTVVIGCYTNPAKRIFVFNVTDPRLDGVKETTAAHEMLHAAYDRLSDSERTRVDALLQAQKAKITDPRLLDIIKYYESSEPGAVVNELHSIFGTEVRDLSPELEAYYKQYFTDRLAVVSFKEKYEKVFTDLADQQTELVNEMNTIARDVNTRQAAYQTSLATLNANIAAFNTWAQSGTASQSEYNTRRAALQRQISALDTERSAINAEIDSYNAKKDALDKLNVQAAALNLSIDSKLEAAPTLQN